MCRRHRMIPPYVRTRIRWKRAIWNLLLRRRLSPNRTRETNKEAHKSRFPGIRTGSARSSRGALTVQPRNTELTRPKSLFLTPLAPTFRQDQPGPVGPAFQRVWRDCRMGSLSIWHWIVVIAVVL